MGLLAGFVQTRGILIADIISKERSGGHMIDNTATIAARMYLMADGAANFAVVQLRNGFLCCKAIAEGRSLGNYFSVPASHGGAFLVCPVMWAGGSLRLAGCACKATTSQLIHKHILGGSYIDSNRSINYGFNNQDIGSVKKSGSERHRNSPRIHFKRF